MKKRYKRNRKLANYWGTMYATTTNADWGFIPIPGKGGATLNFEIPEWMFQRELKEMMEGAANA